MNSQQIQDALRIALAAGGPLAALVLKYTGLTADDYALWLSAILLIVPPVAAWLWGYLKNTHANQVKAVEAMPEVATVVVKDEVRNGVGELAADPTHPNIVTETQNEKDAKKGTKV